MSDYGTVSLDRSPDGVWIVVLSGEHDAGSRSDLTEALRTRDASQSVLVDLTACTFVDSAIIGAILHRAAAFAEAGGRLELIAARGAAEIARTLEVLCVRKLVRVHDSRADALASVRSTRPAAVPALARQSDGTQRRAS